MLQPSLESMWASCQGPQADSDAPSAVSVALALRRCHVCESGCANTQNIRGLHPQLHLCALQAGQALRRGPEVAASHCGVSLRGDGATCA